MTDWSLFIPVLAISLLLLAAILGVKARSIAAVRPWMVVTVLAALAFPLSIVLHNVLSGVTGGEEGISFVVALLVAPLGFTIGLLGGALAVRARERELGSWLLLAGGGVALFALYMLFALVVTTIEGGNPPYQAPIESVVMPVSALAVTTGTVAAVVTALDGGRDRMRAA